MKGDAFQVGYRRTEMGKFVILTLLSRLVSFSYPQFSVTRTVLLLSEANRTEDSPSPISSLASGFPFRLTTLVPRSSSSRRSTAASVGAAMSSLSNLLQSVECWTLLDGCLGICTVGLFQQDIGLFQARPKCCRQLRMRRLQGSFQDVQIHGFFFHVGVADIVAIFARLFLLIEWLGQTKVDKIQRKRQTGAFIFVCFCFHHQ